MKDTTWRIMCERRWDPSPEAAKAVDSPGIRCTACSKMRPPTNSPDHRASLLNSALTRLPAGAVKP